MQIQQATYQERCENKTLLQYYYSHFLAKAVPFRVEFYSDGYEWAPSEGIATNKGAKLYYFQTTC